MTGATSVLLNIFTIELTVAKINLLDLSKHHFLADTNFIKRLTGGLTHQRQVVDLIAKLIDFAYIIHRP